VIVGSECFIRSLAAKSLRKETSSMIGTFHSPKRALLLAALAASATLTGLARADDSSMNPFTGESYAALSAGNRPTIANPQFDNAPSAWRQANPDGLSEGVFQSYSAPGEGWHLTAPTYAQSSAAVQEFHRTHPNGLDERELQALSSDAAAWQLDAGAEVPAPAGQSTTPLSQRLAAFLHRGGATAQ
jgi:hypothetical protein